MDNQKVLCKISLQNVMQIEIELETQLLSSRKIEIRQCGAMERQRDAWNVAQVAIHFSPR